MTPAARRIVLRHGVRGLQISGVPVTTGIEYEHGVGSVYAGFTVSATGGIQPYTYSIASGTLPSGITLDSSTGSVSGTPAAASEGTYSGIVIRATDSVGHTSDLASFTITISYKDPYYANVVLLAGFNGADEDVSYTEEKSGKVATFTGNAKLDTGQVKFGTTALRCDGSGDLISFPDSADWDLGDATTDEYTLETWVYYNSISNANHFILGQSAGAGTVATQWFIPSGNLTNLQWGTASAGSVDFTVLTTSGGLTTGQWFHVLVNHNSSNKCRIFIDGVMRGSGTGGGLIGNSTQSMGIGSNSGNNFSSDAWFDDMRITKGKCRYDSDSSFTPPTRAHPRS